VRKLPEWAERIFTGAMIAASNVQKEEELDQITNMVRKTTAHYLGAVAETNNTSASTKDQQNYYAINQKQNPHTPKVMTSLGLSEEDVTVFIQECLFPQIK